MLPGISPSDTTPEELPAAQQVRRTPVATILGAAASLVTFAGLVYLLYRSGEVSFPAAASVALAVFGAAVLGLVAGWLAGWVSLPSVLGTGATLLVYLGLVLLVAYFSRPGEPAPGAPAREEKLAELRAAEEEALTTYGKGQRPGEYRIPVAAAIDRLVKEAEQKGRLPYPLPKAAEKKGEKK